MDQILSRNNGSSLWLKIKMDQLIEEIIAPFQSQLGKVFIPYKNHVLRVAHFTQLLRGELGEEDVKKIAIAAVFHDLGIWTANTFDYLDPSRKLASEYLKKKGLDEWDEEIGLMIDNHHKIRKFKGGKLKDGTNVVESVISNVEALRKADLIDLSKGLKSFGLSRKAIKDQYRHLPMKGFLGVIIRQFFKNLLRNPLRPLPMMKR